MVQDFFGLPPDGFERGSQIFSDGSRQAFYLPIDLVRGVISDQANRSVQIFLEAMANFFFNSSSRRRADIMRFIPK